MNSDKKSLIIVVVIFFILRISLIFILGKPGTDNWNNWILYPDSQSYISFAQDISNGSYDQPSFRTPVYPIFLYLTEFLINSNWIITLIVQQILVFIAAVLIYRYLYKVLGKPTLIAIILFLLEPNTLIYSYAILPDTLMFFIQIICSLLMLGSIDKTYKNKIIISAIVAFILSIGALTKPVLLYSFVGFVIFILIYFKRQLWKRSIISFVFIVCVFAPIYSLKQYNWYKFDLESISTQSSWEKAGDAIALKQRVEMNSFDREIMMKEMDQILVKSGFNEKNPDYKLRDRAFDSVFTAIVTKYPFHAAYYSIIGSSSFFRPGMPTMQNFLNPGKYSNSINACDYKQSVNFRKYLQSPLSIFELIFTIGFSIILLLSWLLSFLWLKSKKIHPLLFIVNGWFAYSIILLGMYSSPRYRLTFIWGFCMLASLSVQWIREKVISINKNYFRSSTH